VIFEVRKRSFVLFCRTDIDSIPLTDAEQRIAPWQDDAAISRCPLCTYVLPSYICLANTTTFLHKDSTDIPIALPSTHSQTVNTTAASAGPSSAVSLQNSRSALPPVQCSLSSMPRRGALRRSVRVLTTACAVRVLARRRNFSVASERVAAADLCSHDSSTGRRW